MVLIRYSPEKLTKILIKSIVFLDAIGTLLKKGVSYEAIFGITRGTLCLLLWACRVSPNAAGLDPLFQVWTAGVSFLVLGQKSPSSW